MRAAGLLVLGLALALTACARVARPASRYDVVPRPDDWGPHPEAPMEWWYLSGLAGAEERRGAPTLAFHAAFFRTRIPRGSRWLGLPVDRLLRGTYGLATLSVTDFTTGERYLAQATDLPLAWACADGPPLCLRLGPVSLRETAPERWAFVGGPLALALRARAPRVVHPPGWSGGPGMGALAYQSVPRLAFTGRWRGRAVHGEAWLDHQWGDQVPGRDARWDWHGLHLEDGSQVMLYRLTRMDGSDVRLHGTRTLPDGSIRRLEDLSTEPLSTWRGSGRRLYATAWRVRARDLSLTVRPWRADQETPSLAGIVYWEGPVRVEGTVQGLAVGGTGMGEHFPWPLGAVPDPGRTRVRREGGISPAPGYTSPSPDHHP